VVRPFTAPRIISETDDTNDSPRATTAAAPLTSSTAVSQTSANNSSAVFQTGPVGPAAVTVNAPSTLLNLTPVMTQEALNGTTGPIDHSQPSGVSTTARPGLPSLTASVTGRIGNLQAETAPAADQSANVQRRDESEMSRSDSTDMLEAEPLAPELPAEPKPEDLPLQDVDDLSGWMTEGGLSYWLVGFALTGTALESVKHRSQIEEEKQKRARLI